MSNDVFTFMPWREPHPDANFKVTIDFVLEGIRGREVYYVHDERKFKWHNGTEWSFKPMPDGIAWREFEHEMLFDFDMPSEDCTCCLSMELDFYHDVTIERLKEDSSNSHLPAVRTYSSSRPEERAKRQQ